MPHGGATINETTMTERMFFVETTKYEAARFTGVFNALPEGKLDYKHADDPKGKTALQLACSMASEAATFGIFLKTGQIDWSKDAPSPKTLPEAKDMFAKGLAEAGTVAAAMSEEDWGSKAAMLVDGKEVWAATKGGMAWMLMFDLIHHRGQMTTLIRPMGGKVPAIYGPSADSGE